MRVLLISPNTLTVPYPVYPLGLDYVAGSIGPEHELARFDLNCASLDELARLIADFSPEVIGLACRNIDNTEAGAPKYFLEQLHELVLWLRARCQAVIVCGGSGFTIMPEAVLAALEADFGIIGEGERFGLLVEALARGDDPAALPGVLRPNGPVRIAPPWPGLRQRRMAPLPQVAFYAQQHGGMLNLQTKRGCSFRCVYCPYPHIEGRSHRLIPPESVAQTALELEAAGARYIFITDSAFNSHPSHSRAVARAFRASGLRIPWGAFFAPLAPESGYFALMAEAGCKHVEFGTESMSGAILRNYRKPFQPADVFAAHRAARAAGLHVAHYFLLGGPGENAATVQESLSAIEELTGAAFFFFIGIRIYPGTEICEMAIQRGQITADTDLRQPVFYKNSAITRDEMEALVVRQARGRLNWLVGAGVDQVAALVARMHAKGMVGPLWEYLAR